MVSLRKPSESSTSDRDRPAESSIEPPEVAEAPEVAYRALSQSRRRLTAYFLLQNDTEMNVPELALHVAAWENDEPIADVTPEERRRVYTSLQQNHLPKMDEFGFIEYDADRHTIESADDVDELASYLETSPGPSHGVCTASRSASRESSSRRRPGWASSGSTA